MLFVSLLLPPLLSVTVLDSFVFIDPRVLRADINSPMVHGLR